MKFICGVTNTGFFHPAYEIRDLKNSAREKAINDHRNFLADVNRSESGESYADNECADTEIINDIELNEYLFNYDGDLLPITHRCMVNTSNPDAAKSKDYFRLFGEEVEIVIINGDNAHLNHCARTILSEIRRRIDTITRQQKMAEDAYRRAPSIGLLSESERLGGKIIEYEMLFDGMKRIFRLR